MVIVAKKKHEGKRVHVNAYANQAGGQRAASEKFQQRLFSDDGSGVASMLSHIEAQKKTRQKQPVKPGVSAELQSKWAHQRALAKRAEAERSAASAAAVQAKAIQPSITLREYPRNIPELERYVRELFMTWFTNSDTTIADQLYKAYLRAEEHLRKEQGYRWFFCTRTIRLDPFPCKLGKGLLIYPIEKLILNFFILRIY